MMQINELNLKDLQPSQFYISEKKLKDIEAWLNPADLSCFEPIPRAGRKQKQIYRVYPILQRLL